MIRETQEEAGLVVIPESVKEYGYVHRIQKSSHDDANYFIQHNYYFFCDAGEVIRDADIFLDFENDSGFDNAVIFSGELEKI